MAHPPAVLLQLKQENERLRNELRELSASLDEALSKQPKKSANPADSNSHLVRSREVKVLQTRLKQAEKETALLREQVLASAPERLEQMEQEILQCTQMIKARETAIRNLQRQQKERGETLNELTNEPAVLKEIQRKTEEVKVKRHLVDKLEIKSRQGEESEKIVREKVLHLESTLKSLSSHRAQLLSDDEPSKPPILHTDIDLLKAKCTELEQLRETKLSDWRRKLADLETKVQQAATKRTAVTDVSDSKEKMVRILDSKLKEIKRSVVVLQRQNEALAQKTATPNLRPIRPPAIQQEESRIRESAEISTISALQSEELPKEIET